MEVLFDAIEFGEPAFGKTPKRLDAINVRAAVNEGLGLCLVDAQVLVEAYVDQAVIAVPGIGMQHALEADLALDNGPQHLRGGVGDEFGVNASPTFVDAEDWLFGGAATALARAELTAQALRPEVTFVGLYDAHKKRFLLLLVGMDEATKSQEVTVDTFAIAPKQQRALARLDVDAKAANYFTDLIAAYLAALKHLVRLFAVV